MKGERFLPFRRSDVLAMCAEELPAGHERDEFLAFGRTLSSLVHYQFHERIERLKDAYHPFHRGADTRGITELDKDAREEARARLEAELTGLAQAANFTEMSLKEVEEAMAGHSLLKLRLEVDTRDVDKVLLFRRGESVHTRREKRLWGLWRKKVTFTSYSRVLVYAKFKEANGLKPEQIEKLSYEPGSIIVKLFQNVPREDLEMIFPNVRIRMRLIDKLFIGVPALVSGIIVVATKLLIPLAAIVALVGFWIGIEPDEPTFNNGDLVKLGLGLTAFGAYALRQFNSFKNRKIMFMKALSEGLYYRNLDNDAGVFHHLLDAAEEAEVIEALLAYHFLRAAQAPLSVAELDRRVEEWFSARWKHDFDFEVDDGLRKLRDLGLVTVDADERYSPVPVGEALRRLDQLWDDVYTYREPATITQPAVPVA